MPTYFRHNTAFWQHIRNLAWEYSTSERMGHCIGMGCMEPHSREQKNRSAWDFAVLANECKLPNLRRHSSTRTAGFNMGKWEELSFSGVESCGLHTENKKCRTTEVNIEYVIFIDFEVKSAEIPTSHWNPRSGRTLLWREREREREREATTVIAWLAWLACFPRNCCSNEGVNAPRRPPTKGAPQPPPPRLLHWAPNGPMNTTTKPPSTVACTMMEHKSTSCNN